jgi:SAM-dependent methyltransferase
MNEASQTRCKLEFIGWRHGTDKAAGGHDYLSFYGRFFEELRDRPIRLLEIGVFRGQSVKMWEEYFPQGQIIGVDIDSDARQYESERIRIEIADQSNIEHLLGLGERHGPFDIVIDDCSHYWQHQILTLQNLFPFVKHGGFFVVEDIHTSFGGYIQTYGSNSSISTFQYLQKLTRYAVADSQLDIRSEEDPFIRRFAHATEFIAFHRRTAVLRRRRLPVADWPRMSVNPRSSLRWDRDPEVGDEAVPWASLTVHIGYIGDVTTIAREGISGDYMLLGGRRRDPGCTIQGFAVHPADRYLGELQYRALSSDNTWTAWTSDGNFVGTRSRGVGIRGFAVRLGGAMANRFLCTYSGSFVDHADLVEAGNGAECQAEGGELEAMCIILHPVS